MRIDGVYFPDGDTTNDKIAASKEIARHGFQIDSLHCALKHVTNWTIAVDGGSNIGTWSKEMSEYFDHVLAFELTPETFRCLQKNLNGWNITNVTPYNRALSNSKREVGISAGKRSGGNSVSELPNGSTKTSVKTTTIDELALTDLGFLKLDLEGHEGRALQGAQETILKFKPIILIEHKKKLARKYGNPCLATDTLKQLGATLIEKTGPHDIDWIYGW